MLDDRKASILRAVVEEYIRTASPVGSSLVAASPAVAVSSATVRNEMSVLESEGYLVQPHTSAGRIPTEKGYRFFVDHLPASRPLEHAQNDQIQNFFNRTHGELEAMLADTSRLLSAITKQAAVVVAPPAEVATLLSVQLVALSGRTVLVVGVLSSGAVHKSSFETFTDVDDQTLSAASTLLNQELVGSSISALPGIASTGDGELDSVLEAALGGLRSEPSESDAVYVGGTSLMVDGFQAVETIRQVLTILEQQIVVVTLLRDVIDRGLTVAIGSETGVEPLAECSLVVAPYEVDGEDVGTIGVLGPTRMNYPQALAAVAVVSQRLSHRLSEG